MLDIKLIRENPDVVRRNLERRQQPEKLELLGEVIAADTRMRELIKEANALRKRRNDVSSEIATLSKEGKDASSLKMEAKSIPDEIRGVEAELEEKQLVVKMGLMRLPNLLHESVPFGKDDHDNVVVRVWGEPPSFGFSPVSHAELASGLGIVDLERAGKVSGSGFYYLRNELALLDYSIMRFAIDSLLAKGFALIEPPYMIRRSFYEGVTDLSDFENVMYRIDDADNAKDPLYLIATSEHAMGAMLKDEVVNEDALPIKLCGVSPCFRREVGSHGKYTRGIFRVHQFNKIEQFVYCKPEDSWKTHEELLENAEEYMRRLEIPYRVVNICTGDIGTVAAKKYDIEAWFPAQKAYREVVSCSNCTSYQATRLNIKYKNAAGENNYVHTLNSTMVASPRMLVAIIENNQLADGSLMIPKVLRPYMDGAERIEPRKKP